MTTHACAVCGKPWSPFGFGLPPRVPIWACGAHRAEVAAAFVPDAYAPMRRTKPTSASLPRVKTT